MSAKTFATPLRVAVLLLCVTVAAYWDGMVEMVKLWGSDEYSYAYLVAPIAGWLIWRQRYALAAVKPRGSWAGVVLVALGLLMSAFGEISTIYTIIHYAFILTVWGIAVAWLGWRGVKVIAAPLVYLLFMVPLPPFLYQGLSAKLQLISSTMGVAVLRLFDVTVFLEGNVIDLGDYKLQVVEACSGLRYLFPLMSFGFLCACLYRGPRWTRVVLVIVTLPIAVVINSVRIAITGILVNNFGTEVAEGFLHDFEGWIIFLVAIAILFALILLLARLTGHRGTLREILGLAVSDPHPAPASKAAVPAPGRPCLTALALLTVAALGSFVVPARTEVIPERPTFASFPLRIGDWQGRESTLDRAYINLLKFDDYVIADYVRTGQRAPINFYVAYYTSQRKGASAHSPRSCLPGGGWEMTEFGQTRLLDISPDEPALVVNRTIIAKGTNKQLVYYWFQQRGHDLTNEYQVKWMIFWDALTRNRTDGALVRLVTSLEPDEAVASADQRLTEFIRAVYPQVELFVPS